MTAARARKKSEPQQAPLPLQIVEGVHLNLPQQLYFEARALGSSDFHILATDAPSWWFGSDFNPDRKARKKRVAHLAFGSALHALILEGEHAYTSRFVIQPDPESTRYARTREAMMKLLTDRGEHVPIKKSFDDGWMWAKIREHGVQHLVWETANQDYERARRAGFEVITEDEDRRLRRMAHLVATHDDLGPNLKKGLAEVSVFWRKPERPEILLRARFDKLLPDFTIDLKTFSNTRDESPEEATFNAIASEGYDLQAEHYREAREMLAKFVKEGRVFAWGDDDGRLGNVKLVKGEKDALESIAAATEWRWVWIFYQVQSDNPGSERAPIVVPWWTWPRGEMFDRARTVIDTALDEYTAWVSRRGLAQPWAEVRKIRELPVDRLKRLAFKRTVQ